MEISSYNKNGTFSFTELNDYHLNDQMTLIDNTDSNANECHFFITIIITIKSNRMIERYLRTLIIKILFFIFIKPPLKRDLVDVPNVIIQQVNYQNK